MTPIRHLGLPEDDPAQRTVLLIELLPVEESQNMNLRQQEKAQSLEIASVSSVSLSEFADGKLPEFVSEKNHARSGDERFRRRLGIGRNSA